MRKAEKEDGEHGAVILVKVKKLHELSKKIPQMYQGLSKGILFHILEEIGLSLGRESQVTDQEQL